MAKKFGGKFSPDGTTGDADLREAVVDARKVDAAGAKATVLFLPGVILAFLSLNEGAVGLILGLLGAGVLTLSAWLTRDGLRAAAAYDQRRVARKPAVPRKLLGTILVGAGIAIASYSNDASVLAAVLYGSVAGILHTMAFGVDPMRDKRVEGIDTFQQDRVAKVVDQAEGHLAAMTDHIASIKDRKLDQRVAQFQVTARRMIRTVEGDPRDLTRGRKFMTVYLEGARDAAAKFAAIYKDRRDEQARQDFEGLLAQLELSYADNLEKMLLDERSDMDIEIKVLRDRLQREGL